MRSESVAGVNSTTTQQVRNKANGELNDVKTCEFSGITKMRSESVAGVKLDNNTASTKQSER